MLGVPRHGKAQQGKVLTEQLTQAPARHVDARPADAGQGMAWQGFTFTETEYVMRKLKVAELVLDFDLYPRNNVDTHNVARLVNALAAGEELPPVIIDKKSKRVVDGFHRIRAHRKFIGDEAEIEVIEKSYKDDAAIFLDAMRYNAAHGENLDPFDRTHCVLIAERLNIPLDAVAGALRMPVDKLGSLRADRTATHGGMTIALKRTIHHKAGQKLTQRQSEANNRLSGMNQSFYVNQVIELIEADLLDTSDETLMDRLTHLRGLLDNLVVTA